MVTYSFLRLAKRKWKLAISVVSLGTFEFVLQKCLFSSPPCFIRLLYFGWDKNSGFLVLLQIF